jgi:hypothetical protein
MIGLTSIALSAAAVVTGINYQLGQGSCYYSGYNKADFIEKEYAGLPLACQIANGLGVCVLLAATSVFIAVGLRNYTSDLPIKASYATIVADNNMKVEQRE